MGMSVLMYFMGLIVNILIVKIAQKYFKPEKMQLKQDIDHADFVNLEKEVFNRQIYKRCRTFEKSPAPNISDRHLFITE